MECLLSEATTVPMHDAIWMLALTAAITMATKGHAVTSLSPTGRRARILFCWTFLRHTFPRFEPYYPTVKTILLESETCTVWPYASLSGTVLFGQYPFGSLFSRITDAFQQSSLSRNIYFFRKGMPADCIKRQHFPEHWKSNFPLPKLHQVTCPSDKSLSVKFWIGAMQLFDWRNRPHGEFSIWSSNRKTSQWPARAGTVRSIPTTTSPKFMFFQQRQWYTGFPPHLEIFLLLSLFAFDNCAGLFFVLFLRNSSFLGLRFLSVSLGRFFFFHSTIFLRRILFWSRRRFHFRTFLRNFLVGLLSFLPLLLQHRSSRNHRLRLCLCRNASSTSGSFSWLLRWRFHSTFILKRSCTWSDQRQRTWNAWRQLLRWRNCRQCCLRNLRRWNMQTIHQIC